MMTFLTGAVTRAPSNASCGMMSSRPPTTSDPYSAHAGLAPSSPAAAARGGRLCCRPCKTSRRVGRLVWPTDGSLQRRAVSEGERPRGTCGVAGSWNAAACGSSTQARTTRPRIQIDWCTYILVRTMANFNQDSSASPTSIKTQVPPLLAKSSDAV